MKQTIILLIALQFFCCNTEPKIKNTEAKHVRVIHQNGKVGFETLNDSLEVINTIEPLYDHLFFYTSITLGGVDIGKFYRDDRNLNDTEYIQLHVDPNDPTFYIDTFLVNDLPALISDKLILAKKNSRWGLLHSTGKEALPFEYDSIKIFGTALNESDGPLFVLIKNNKASIINQKKEVVLSEQLFQQYYPGLSLKAQLHALEIAFLNGYLLVQQNGRFIDTFRTLSPTTDFLRSGNTIDTIQSPAMALDEYYFRGGRFNVVSNKTGKLMFEEWHRKILLKFTSQNPEFRTLSIDPTNKDSAMYVLNPFAETNAVNANIEFVPVK